MLCVVLLCGCSSIFNAHSRKEPMMAFYSAGDYSSSVNMVDEWSESHEGTGDELMWRLEQGTIKFHAGDYKGSLEAFERAESIVEDFEARAAVSARDVGAETGSIFTNPNALPYKGFNYDLILLNTYKALVYFALGDPSAGRVELRRAYYRQKAAAERFRSEIESREEEIKEQRHENRKNNYKTSACSFGNLVKKNKRINTSYESLKKYSNEAYGDFVNPFTTYLSAISYLMDGNYGEAFVDFSNLYRMDRSNRLVQRDLVTVARNCGQRVPEELGDVEPHGYPLDDNIIYIIFENGMAPVLKEVKVQIILPPPIPTGYSGFAYPELLYTPCPSQKVSVCCGKRSASTVPVADMDAIVSREYIELLPLIITRTALAVVTKEIASYIAQEAAEQAGGAYAKWGTVVATSIYKYMFNTADTRCWETLPKEYQLTHIPIPESRKLAIALVGSAGVDTGKLELELKPGTGKAIVYVKSTGASAPVIKLFEFD